MPPVICIVGTSKKGKTKLMIELIKNLKERGMKVGALKYHKHGDFEIDIEGKDTWKYSKAKADTVGIASSLKFAFVKNKNVPTDIDEIISAYFNDCDAVLADGFTLSDKPRIIVVEDKNDAAMFEKGCRIISITDELIPDLKSIQEKVYEFLIT